jgi:hypothetical protein
MASNHSRAAEPPDPRFGSDRNAHVGDQGELWFAAQLPFGWVWQPPRRDLGKDGLIVIRDKSDLHNLEFAVQVKTSERPVIQRGWVVKSGLSRSSVMYWFASPLPTLVVAVDMIGRRAWYAWHLDLFESPATVFRSTERTVTIRIPEQNELNEAGWQDIRHRLKEHFGSLLDAISEANSSSRLLPAVNTLARNVSNLLKLSKTPPPASTATMTEQEGLSILIEQLEHRSVLSVVRTLLEHVPPDSRAGHHMRAWIDAYEATVLTAHPHLNALPDHGPYSPELEIAFAPKQVVETRHHLIEAGLDMIMLLTARQKAANNDETSDRVRGAADGSPSSGRRGSSLSVAHAAGGLPVKVNIVRLRVTDLGFPEGARTREIIGTEHDTDQQGHSAPFTAGRGSQLGLKLCPPEAAPSLRLEYTDQPPDERLYVAMKPITSSDGEPRIFVLEHSAQGVSLDAVRARPDDEWRSTDTFIFCTGL